MTHSLEQEIARVSDWLDTYAAAYGRACVTLPDERSEADRWLIKAYQATHRRESRLRGLRDRRARNIARADEVRAIRAAAWHRKGITEGTDVTPFGSKEKHYLLSDGRIVTVPWTPDESAPKVTWNPWARGPRVRVRATMETYNASYEGAS